MKTKEIIAAIEKKDAALHQARHLMKKWEEGFDIWDFCHDVDCWLLDVEEALGEKT
tara:strand:- start:344 stop:511 length:168 start_codon:yes stop_codon:yes gene_type:complete